ncbi:MAG: TOBE domain-containing protein, partial [Pseudomonadota bacterium]
PDEIYARPKSRFVAEFMGEVNLVRFTSSPQGVVAGPVTLSADASKRLCLRTGSSGTLVIRPETLRFLGETEEAEAMTEGCLHAEYALGSRNQYEIDLPDGTRLTAEVLRKDRPAVAPGGKVRLGWDLAHCHLIEEH